MNNAIGSYGSAGVIPGGSYRGFFSFGSQGVGSQGAGSGGLSALANARAGFGGFTGNAIGGQQVAADKASANPYFFGNSILGPLSGANYQNTFGSYGTQGQQMNDATGLGTGATSLKELVAARMGR